MKCKNKSFTKTFFSEYLYFYYLGLHDKCLFQNNIHILLIVCICAFLSHNINIFLLYCYIPDIECGDKFIT